MLLTQFTTFQDGRAEFVASHPFAKNANGWGTQNLFGN
jgi:hypothetical protein